MMDKKEAIKLLMNHTQHFVPNDDLEALYMAVESLEREVEKELKEAGGNLNGNKSEVN